VSEPLFDLGDGLEVRVLEADDAHEVFALVDRERARLREWMPWVDGTESPDDTREFIEQSRRAEHDHDGLGLFVDGGYVGGIGLRVDVLQRNGEVGYWIAAAWEGRGVVTRACEALIRYAFGDLALHRVSISVAPANARSRAIPERLGFTEEAVLRQAGRTDAQGFVDLIVYGLLEDEWASR
jgi:ribosomal-protein-serine acetyltransferase